MPHYLIPAAATVVFLVLLESGIRQWRASAPISDDPVWSLSVAEKAWGNTDDIRRAVEIYGADRGTELELERDRDKPLSVFYFEWDELEAGPFIAIGGHPPEVCNVIAGMDFIERVGERQFSDPGLASIRFDVTRFDTPAGTPVYVYKAVWLQGLGDWDFRKRAEDRAERMRRSFLGIRGQARVLQVGVFGTADEADAWKAVQSAVESEIVTE